MPLDFITIFLVVVALITSIRFPFKASLGSLCWFSSLSSILTAEEAYSDLLNFEIQVPWGKPFGLIEFNQGKS